MIPFTSVSFKAPQISADELSAAERGLIKRNPLPPGRLALTNQRLFFICRRESGVNGIRKLNPSKKTHYEKNYWVDTTVKEAIIFFPIDIKHVMHIRFHMEVRIQSIPLSNVPHCSHNAHPASYLMHPQSY